MRARGCITRYGTERGNSVTHLLFKLVELLGDFLKGRHGTAVLVTTLGNGQRPRPRQRFRLGLGTRGHGRRDGLLLLLDRIRRRRRGIGRDVLHVPYQHWRAVWV